MRLKSQRGCMNYIRVAFVSVRFYWTYSLFIIKIGAAAIWQRPLVGSLCCHASPVRGERLLSGSDLKQVRFAALRFRALAAVHPLCSRRLNAFPYFRLKKASLPRY